MDAATMDPRRRTLINLTLMVATVMQALDATIANVALPHMRGSFSATQDQISWVLTSYIVASAIMVPLSGFLSGLIGRKNLLMWSIVGFTLASMACGVAESLGEMVIFRLIQGVCGASLMPVSQAIILDIYPKEKHGQAMAIWGIGVMVGPILGPTLGGYLTEYMNWRWVFFINVPFGLIGFLGVVALLTETERDKERRFDMFGFALLSIGIGALQLALDRGQSKDWFNSPEILIEAFAAVIAIYFFIVHMLTAEHPFVDRRMFADRNFVIGILYIFLISMTVFSTAALLPPFLEDIRGFPVELTGLVMAPRGAATMIAMLIAGRLVGKVDLRLLLGFGVFLVVLSLSQMSAFSADVGYREVILTGLIQGFGLGFLFVPLTTITYATLPGYLRSDAVGVFGMMRNVGGSIGVSIAFAMLTRQTQISHAELVEHINPYNPLLQAFSAFDSTNTSLGTTALAMIDGEINRQAGMIAFLDDFILTMFACLAMLPLLLFLRPPKQKLTLNPAEMVSE